MSGEVSRAPTVHSPGATMRLGAWAWLLCLAVTAREGSGEGVLTKGVVAYNSFKPLRRYPRAFCSQSISCRLVEARHQDVTSFPECGCLLTDTHTPHAPQMVNSTTIGVTLNLTEPDEFKLICTDRNGNTCVAQVKIGYEPLDVKDLKCISHNWESFSCHWNLSDNPVQEEEYVPYLISTEDPSKKNLCGCTDKDSLLDDTCSCRENCCLWSGEQYFNTDRQVVVMFQATNELGDANFNYTIDNYAVVVPAKMSNVSVAGVAGRREAVVWWKLAAPMGTFAEAAAGVVVQVDHRLAQGVDSPLVLAPSLPSSSSSSSPAAASRSWIQGAPLPCHNHACKTGQHTISLEFWWCRFEVRVRVRSAAAPAPLEEDEWWSDWEPRNVTTPPSAPNTPPAVGPGTFQVAARGFPGLCDVTLTWQQVPPLLHNGPDFGYLVQVCGASRGGEGEGECEGEGEAVLAQVAVRESFVVFRNLSTAAPYTLRVAARNSEGHSGTWGAVSVPPDRPALPLLPVVVQHDRAGQDTLYELRWYPGDATSHTVYVCTGEHEGTNPCTGQLAWTTVANASAANLTLRDFGLLGAAEQVTFALSREDQAGTSSGLAWDRCFTPQPFNTARDPPSPGKEPLAGSSWVKLSWSLDCRSWAGVVEAMEAAYCRGAHRYPSNCTAVVVEARDVWQKSFMLHDLESDAQYTAWLRILYRSGLSQWSESVTFSTSTAGVKAWLIVVVVTVALLSTVAVLLVLVYSKRKFVDNLKKLRLQPSLPSGLVPEGQQDSRGGGGGGGGGGDGESGADGIPVDKNTISGLVKNPSYSHILPTIFGRRPSLTMEEERDNEVSGRGVAWGGTVAPSAHYHRGETDDNAQNAAAEQAATDEGGEFSCSASSSTSEPLLRRRAPGYVVPYFPESESEVRDASPTEPLFPRSEAGRQAGGGGGSLGGGCGGYVAPSECHWLPGTSGYVAVQHGHDTGASAPGYVQADAFPHATVAPGAADARNCPAEGHWYVGLDSPVVGGDPARSQDPPDLTHDPVTCVTPAIPSPDSPAPSHDPGVPSLVSMSPGGGERNAEAQEQGKPSYVALPDAQLSMKWLEADHAASCDNKPSYVTLPDAQHSLTWLDADQVTSSDVEPSYVSLPDAQLSMKWQSGDLATPGDGKLCAKESERQEKPPCPPGGTPAPGYIAVQPPDFGKPAEESTRLMEKGLDLEPYLPDDDFMSAMLLKPKHALAMPHSALPAAFPAVFPGALEVPNVAHKPDVPSTGDVPGEAQERYNLLAGTAEVGEYLPLPELATDDKSDTNTTRNSWLASLLPSASLSPLTPTQHPATGISFVMLSNLFSRSDKSDESDLKESEMNAYSDTDERAENEENEAAENEIHALVDLPEGYSRVGDEE